MIDVQGLRKSYPGRGQRVDAVNGISFTIGRGEVFGFLGPNGAGKTTSIKMLAGLVRRDEGVITIGGKDPDRDRSALKEIGVVLEGNRNLYWRLTAEENIEYFGVLRGLTAREARRRGAGLLDRFALARRRVPVSDLSRGMQQKVALAVALVHEPGLLLFDEPTLGLDVETAESVKDIIREAAKAGRAVLLTTHVLTVAEELSDRVAIINHGRVVVQASPSELIRRFSGDTYRVEVDGEVGPERWARLEELGVWRKNGHVEFMAKPETLYEVINTLKPLPILRLERDQANLTGVFLRLMKEGFDVAPASD
jgi:ABC-2 type transport system ATP-binding protein